MAWTGFTDAQLNALKRQPSDEEEQTVRDGAQGQHAQRGHSQRGQTQRGQAQRGRGRPGNYRGRGRGAVATPSLQHEPVSQDQMLSRPKQSGLRGKPISAAESNVWGELKEPSPARPPPARRRGPPPPQEKAPEGGGGEGRAGPQQGGDGRSQGKETGVTQEAENGVEAQEDHTVDILDESQGREREMSKIEEFQKIQKQIEEDNAKKKNLLARAIADRKKKTQAESKRLVYIQKELAKIETLLTNDVSILRDRIEGASKDFNDAQRRYQKAEAEFVAAKMHLHKMEDMKESLTEHLCTIIRENELRKAKKLEELVSKLDVENLDEFEIPESTPPTSPLQRPLPIPTAAAPTPVNNGTVLETNAPSGGRPAQQGESTLPVGMPVPATHPAKETPQNTERGNSESKPSPVDSKEKTEEKVKEKVEEKLKEKVEEKTKEQSEKISPPAVEPMSSSDQPEAEQHVELGADQT